jgi:acetylornithine deacetylase/succinyl-diaminopimelate desuccinylase-like protein
MLARLLASMRDEEGLVLIRGFYDRVEPLTAAEKEALAETPAVDDSLRAELGLVRTEGAGQKIEQIINRPTLNVRGLRSADTGSQSRNVVPASATASIDLRLVMGLSPEHAFDLVAAHIRRQGFHVTDSEPDAAMRKQFPKIARLTRSGGYPAAKTPMDLLIVREVVAAIARVRGPVVRMPTLGGSVPLYILTQELKAPFVGVPIANHDNNQHAANENIRLDNLWAGIDVMAALMTLPGRVP